MSRTYRRRRVAAQPGRRRARTVTADGQLWVVEHAVRRFRERHEPTLSFDEARAALRALTATARPLPERSRGGQEVWLADGDVPLVVRWDSDLRCRVVLTVLTAEMLASEEVSDVCLR